MRVNFVVYFQGLAGLWHVLGSYATAMEAVRAARSAYEDGGRQVMIKDLTTRSAL